MPSNVFQYTKKNGTFNAASGISAVVNEPNFVDDEAYIACPSCNRVSSYPEEKLDGSRMVKCVWCSHFWVPPAYEPDMPPVISFLNPIMRGQLHKRHNKRFNRNWKHRYCILNDDVLYWLVHDKEPFPIGRMRLSDVDVTFKRRPGTHTFELSTSKTDIVFKAPNEEEYELWVKSIQRIVAKSKRKHDIEAVMTLKRSQRFSNFTSPRPTIGGAGRVSAPAGAGRGVGAGPATTGPMSRSTTWRASIIDPLVSLASLGTIRPRRQTVEERGGHAPLPGTMKRFLTVSRAQAQILAQFGELFDELDIEEALAMGFAQRNITMESLGAVSYSALVELVPELIARTVLTLYIKARWPDSLPSLNERRFDIVFNHKPLRFEVMEKSLVIVNVEPKSEAFGGGMRRGCRIVKVDGEPPPEECVADCLVSPEFPLTLTLLQYYEGDDPDAQFKRIITESQANSRVTTGVTNVPTSGIDHSGTNVNASTGTSNPQWVYPGYDSSSSSDSYGDVESESEFEENMQDELESEDADALEVRRRETIIMNQHRNAHLSIGDPDLYHDDDEDDGSGDGSRMQAVIERSEGSLEMTRSKVTILTPKTQTIFHKESVSSERSRGGNSSTLEVDELKHDTDVSSGNTTIMDSHSVQIDILDETEKSPPSKRGSRVTLGIFGAGGGSPGLGPTRDHALSNSRLSVSSASAAGHRGRGNSDLESASARSWTSFKENTKNRHKLHQSCDFFAEATEPPMRAHSPSVGSISAASASSYRPPVTRPRAMSGSAVAGKQIADLGGRKSPSHSRSRTPLREVLFRSDESMRRLELDKVSTSSSKSSREHSEHSVRSDLLSPAFNDGFAVPQSPSLSGGGAGANGNGRKSVAHRKQQQHRRRAAAAAAEHRRSRSDMHSLASHSSHTLASASPGGSPLSASSSASRMRGNSTLYSASQDHSPSTSRVPLLDREATGLIMHTERHHPGMIPRSRASSVVSQPGANVNVPRPPAVPISGGVSTVRHRPDSITRHFVSRQRSSSLSADHSITSSRASLAQEERYVRGGGGGGGGMRAMSPNSPSSSHSVQPRARGTSEQRSDRDGAPRPSRQAHNDGEEDHVSYSDSEEKHEGGDGECERVSYSDSEDIV